MRSSQRFQGDVSSLSLSYANFYYWCVRKTERFVHLRVVRLEIFNIILYGTFSRGTCTFCCSPDCRVKVASWLYEILNVYVSN